MEVRITVCLDESGELRVERQSRKRKLRVESLESVAQAQVESLEF